MIIVDIQHQYRVVNIGRFIERYNIPCEGAMSRVTGDIFVVIKDYTNLPTIDSFNISFGQTNYRLLPNNEITYYAEFGGVALVVLPNPLAVVLPFMKDSDIGIKVNDFITEPMGQLEVNINFSAVPSAFNFYVRPRLEVNAMQPIIQGNLRTEGTRKDVAYVRDTEDFAPIPAPHPGGTAGGQGIGAPLDLSVIPAAVKIEDVKE